MAESINKEQLVDVVSSTNKIFDNDLVVDDTSFSKEWFLNNEYCDLNVFNKRKALMHDLTERKNFALEIVDKETEKRPK